MDKKTKNYPQKRIHIRNTYTEEELKNIAKNCGDKDANLSINYIRRAKFNGANLIVEIADDVAFFIATLNKNHMRLIQIATEKDSQNKGYGTLLIMRMKMICQAEGKKKITLKTKKDGYAKRFYMTHFNAKIVGEKNDEYEMEIKV